MPDALHSPTHDLPRLRELVRLFPDKPHAHVPAFQPAPAEQSRGANRRPWKLRLMAFLDERLPVWRSLKVQQKQIDALTYTVAQQAARIENLTREQRRLRARLLSGEFTAQGAAWYQALQDEHRGQPAARVAQFRVYLEHFDSIPEHVRAAAPVVDLGCGQGEWLSAMTDHGLQAVGVDSNADSVARARARGCRAELADLIDYLRTLPDQSVAGVTAMQVVEHLPWAQVMTLFTEAFRVTAGGGLILLETPNPENLQVAGYSFWMDPTHQQPMPAPLLLHLAQFVGYEWCQVLRSSPWPEWQAPEAGVVPEVPEGTAAEEPAGLHTGDPGVVPLPGSDSEPAGHARNPGSSAGPQAGAGARPGLPEPLNSLLFGPQDYALLAYRPG